MIDFALQGGGSHGAVCGSTHRKSYRDIVIVGIVGAVSALVVVIAIGSMVGFFRAKSLSETDAVAACRFLPHAA